MIYTSYWGNLKELIRDFGKDKIIGVSRFCSFWKGKKCSMLFPSEELLKGYKSGKISEKEYEKIYMDYLDSLNVDNCYKVFNGCVFVCYEKSGFCHRHIISKWLRKNGYDCVEYGTDEDLFFENEIEEVEVEEVGINEEFEEVLEVEEIGISEEGKIIFGVKVLLLGGEVREEEVIEEFGERVKFFGCDVEVVFLVLYFGVVVLLGDLFNLLWFIWGKYG